MTLYVKSNCPFSAKVIAFLKANNLEYEEKNVSDPKVVKEMVRLGGKKREPFLVDGDTMMYESESIINYLERKYMSGNGSRPKIHYAKGTEVCP